MNRVIELILLWMIIIGVLFTMFMAGACSPILPWVGSNDGECITGLCPKWMGCLKVRDSGLIRFEYGYREYKSERAFWYDNGTGINEWEKENCEVVDCKCDVKGCAAYCVSCGGSQ